MCRSAPRRSVRSRPQNLTYDPHIRELLFSELNRQSWLNLKANDIVVEQDAVWLYGTVRDEEEKRTIILTAPKLPGIRRVVSRLAFCVQPSL
jgi:osmotically-inducible protein OsmY